MARTFISQPSQVFKSEGYDDTLSAGSTLESASTNLQTDLNAIRSQIRKILWHTVSGSWYDAVTGSLTPRGLNTVNRDLYDLEQKKFLFRQQNLNVIHVATGSNFALLSTSLGTAPASFAAVGSGSSPGTVTGSIVYAFQSGGEYNVHSIGQVSCSSVLSPKNLVLVRNAWTGLPITSSTGRDIFGLLQAENGTVDGDTFNDTTKRTQISFVVEQIVNSTSSFAAAQGTWIGGKSITYSYVKRVDLDSIPEDAYLSNQVFFDMTDGASSTEGGVVLTDVTLDRAIDNQVGTVSQVQNIAIDVNRTFSWAFVSASARMWELFSNATDNALTVNVATYSISGTNPVAFQRGISVATGSTTINLGLAAGTIATLSASNLILSGGAQLQFSDIFGPVSTYSGGAVPFATSSAEWNTFTTGFGSRSLLGSLNFISASLSGSYQIKRTRFNAGVTVDCVADTNITFPTNIDALLPSLVGKDFRNGKDVNIHMNGVLLLNGMTVGDPNDVYPGTTLSSGDLKFPYTVRSGSIITVEVF